MEKNNLENLKKDLIYLYDKNNSKLYEEIKKKIILILKYNSKSVVDILLYLYVRSLNDKRDKLKSLLVNAIKKIENKHFEFFIKDLMKIVGSLIDEDQKDTYIFLQKIFSFKPSWVYMFLKKRKGLLDKGLYEYFKNIERNFEKLEILKNEVEELIQKNINYNTISFNTIDYFKEFLKTKFLFK